jgi:hypothetical protein
VRWRSATAVTTTERGLSIAVSRSRASSWTVTKTTTSPRSYPHEAVHWLDWAVVLGCLVGYGWAGDGLLDQVRFSHFSLFFISCFIFPIL